MQERLDASMPCLAVPRPTAPRLPEASQAYAPVKGPLGPAKWERILLCAEAGSAYLITGIICGTNTPKVQVVLATPLHGSTSGVYTRRPTAVVIKILLKTSMPSWALLQEATAMQITSSPGHPAVAVLLDCFEDKERVYLIIEYCPGADLCNLITNSGNRGLCNEDKACKYLLQVSSIVYIVSVLHLRLSCYGRF